MRQKILAEEFVEFLKSCSDIELVYMQYEANRIDDKPTLDAVLKELSSRK